MSQEQQQAWAEQMIQLLLDMKAAVEQARSEGCTRLHALELQDWKGQCTALLQEGYQANPPDPPPLVSKKGRRKQSPARNLLDRLCMHQQAVLAFLDNFAVPFDNSQAERDIRMVKVQQKVSGCFHSGAGAQAFCRIRGYLSTLRKQGLPVLSALEQALVGQPVCLHPSPAPSRASVMLRCFMSLDDLLLEIQTTPDCRVDVPRGLPLSEHAHRLPDDVRQFYQQCAGLSLAEHSLYPVSIVPPTQCLLANPVILGEMAGRTQQAEGNDLSWSWYIIAECGDGDYLTIDLDPQRLGRCYDSFHETHGLVGDTPIIALSFTELLTRLYVKRGQHWYWLQPDFVSLGDAYDEVS